MRFRIEHLFHIAVIGGDEQMASGFLDGGYNSVEQASMVSTALIEASKFPVCPTMSPFA